MLPLVHWKALVPAGTEVDSREIDSRCDGNVSDFEVEVINRLVRHHQPRNLFEIGTFDGRTTLNMAANAPADAHVHTLDLPSSEASKTALRIEQSERLFIEKSTSGDRFKGSDQERKITQLYGDSAQFDFQPFYKNVDFIFIDGSHSYEYVIKDTDTAFKLMRESGVMIWHDYVNEGPTPWPGVPKALHELAQKDPRCRNLAQIVGTSIVYLQVPGERTPHVDFSYVGTYDMSNLDSSQPDELFAELDVQIENPTVTDGDSFRARVVARNVGRATWLPLGVPLGPVNLGVRLLARDGTWIDHNYGRAALPPNIKMPGDQIEFVADVAAPPRGEYLLYFDLVAEGVAWFARNSAERVKIPVEVR